MSLPTTNKVYFSSEVFGGRGKIREIPLQKPGKNQVLVKMEYAPINPTDTYAMKRYYNQTELYTKDTIVQLSTEPAPVGSEGSGVIVAVGDELNYSFKVNDRVHVANGTWAQYRLIETENVFPIQGDLPMEEAASHYINPITVRYMGELCKRNGHKAVVHTVGSSALGRMLIRYMKLLGIKLINIVRREEYIETLKSEEGAEYVLNSTAPDYEQRLKELAEKENATIAFDGIAGTVPNTLFKAMPKHSDVYVYGALSSSEMTISVTSLTGQKTLKLLGYTDYVAESIEKNEHKKLFEEVHGLLPTVFSSKIQKVFDFKDVDSALDFFELNSSKGKVLLKLN